MGKNRNFSKKTRYFLSCIIMFILPVLIAGCGGISTRTLNRKIVGTWYLSGEKYVYQSNNSTFWERTLDEETTYSMLTFFDDGTEKEEIPGEEPNYLFYEITNDGKLFSYKSVNDGSRDESLAFAEEFAHKLRITGNQMEHAIDLNDKNQYEWFQDDNGESAQEPLTYIMTYTKIND